VLPFDHLFPELATREVLLIEDASTRPSTIFVFREFYCTDPRCDCRRVVLHATVDSRPRVIASIGYGFEPPLPPFEDEPQALLDPINPQSEMSDTVLDLFTTFVEREPAIRERLISHYVRWKTRTWWMTRGIPIIERSGAPTTTMRRSVQHTRLATKAFRPTSAASAGAARSTRTVADEQRLRLRGPLGHKGDLQRVHGAHHASWR
jgi:hypothetical protein